MTSESLDIP